MSEGTSAKRDSHPIRLALLLLLGARIGFDLSNGPGNSLDLSHVAQPYIGAMIGSLIGLAVELYLRFKPRISIEFLVAVVASGVLAIAWAIVH
jgi:ABC-type Mn2+/Zn2+ transport system permease subunit